CSPGTIRLFFDETVEAVHFSADPFLSPDQALLINADETAALRNSPHNYRPIPPKNLPFPSLRRCSGHAFPKRGLTPTEEIPPLKKGIQGILSAAFSRCHRLEFFNELLGHHTSVCCQSTSESHIAANPFPPSPSYRATASTPAQNLCHRSGSRR